MKKKNKQLFNSNQPQLTFSFSLLKENEEPDQKPNKKTFVNYVPVTTKNINNEIFSTEEKEINSESFLPPLKKLEEEKVIFSVSEVSLKIRNTIEENFRNLSIKGEISGLKHHTSGHYYFVLKDAHASIDAVCWRGTPLGIKPEEGLEIIAKGRITTYSGRSKYQLIVERAEISGEGALLKLLQERKAQFSSEGLFNNKRPIPKFPRCIGVVTSATGAVIRDILHRISHRFPCHVVVWPVLVQGSGADKQIADAINGFNNSKTTKPDVIIVARGGGSVEDLWSFNEEVVIRSAFRSQIPIISAIGHETDTTLMDFAADIRAPTPTAAAEIATPMRSQIIFDLSNFKTRLHNILQRILDFKEMHFKTLSRALPNINNMLENASLRLDDWGERFISSMKALIHFHTLNVQNFASRISAPSHIISQNNHKLHEHILLLKQYYENKYRDCVHRFSIIEQRLELVSYQRSLERGFCYIESSEKSAITNVQQFKQTLGSPQKIHFHDGSLEIISREAS